MAGILDTVDQRTQLVGENRLEILMFRLAGRQLFAINVFKVQEVLQLPKLTLMPQRHPFVCGVVNLRGQTLPVIDLSQAIGMRPLVPGPNSTIIVTEYNRSVQAFLVGGVDRIVNMNWEAILPPPTSAGRQHYLTAISKVDDQLVEIIDVEKVLAEIVPYNAKVSATNSTIRCWSVPVVVKCCWWMTPTWPCRSCVTPSASWGEDAHRQRWPEGAEHAQGLGRYRREHDRQTADGLHRRGNAGNGRLSPDHRDPQRPRLRGLYVVLHTSLSGSFNDSMVKKVGCDNFLSKFQPDKLVDVVRQRLMLDEVPA
jgi:two-component system chemotaxis response regulator CheV